MTSSPKMPRASAYAVFTRNSQKKRPLGSTSDSEEMFNTVTEKDYEMEPTMTEVHVKSSPVTNKHIKDDALNGDVKHQETVPVSKKKKSKKGIKDENTIPIKTGFLEEEVAVEQVEAITNGHCDIDIKPSRSLHISAATPLSVSKKITKTADCGNPAAEEAFNWLLNPFKPDIFFKDIFEKKPHYFRRSNPNYYKGLFSSKEFDEIIRENRLNYDEQIDVLSYVNGERRPVSNDMMVHADFLWNAYSEGNSIRMRNPQAYHKSLWKLCSLLQEYFSSSVGVNMYLTPEDTQGFPPHYDDIDAFILQIEGKKIWKIYEPRNENEVLPRFPSEDFNEFEIGEPCLEVELSAGDMLYFPRGYIHQAKAATDMHSLHLTISTNQLNTWGDLLQSGLSYALGEAIKSNVELRKSLPKDYLDYAGNIYSDNISLERKLFVEKAMSLAQEALKNFSVDYAADAHSIGFIHGSMPPVLSKRERECSIHGNSARLENGVVFTVQELTPDTKIKWIRKRAFRLVIDENGVRLFYTLANSKNSKEEEALFLEVDFDILPAVNALFKNYPDFTKVKNLPIDCMETKMAFAQQLYDNGFLITNKPLPLESTD